MKVTDLFALLLAVVMPFIVGSLILFFQPEALWLRLKLLFPSYRRKVCKDSTESTWCVVRAMARHKGVLYLHVIEELRKNRKSFLIALAEDDPYILVLWKERRNERLTLRFKSGRVITVDYVGKPGIHIEHLHHQLRV